MAQTLIHRSSPRLTGAARSFTNLGPKVVAAALGCFAVSGPALACSGVGPAGAPVVFGGQTNIIIWDAHRKVEHFIRNASFRSGAQDFGFIAPTPGKPKLHEASTKAFYTLASLAPVFRSSVNLSAGAGMGGMGGGRAAVQVIQEADVAGFHATTLWSTDAHAINDWMNAHGYVSTPEVEKWAERYTAKGWYLTAFKVIDKDKSAASTGTVRMSFHTEKPYNPFYVPATNIPINGGSTLKVYFVSVGDYEARIGGEETWQTPVWKAPIPDAIAKKLATEAEFTAPNIPKGSEVETFVDNNFPRAAADDIYFNKVGVAPVPEARPEAPTTPPVQAPPLLACLGLIGMASLRRKAS